MTSANLCCNFSRMPVVAASSYFEIPSAHVAPPSVHRTGSRLYGGLFGDIRCQICACVRGWGVCERSSQIFSFWQSKEWSEARGVPDLHKWPRWKLGGPFEKARGMPVLARDVSSVGSELCEPLLREDDDDDGVCVLRGSMFLREKEDCELRGPREDEHVLRGPMLLRKDDHVLLRGPMLLREDDHVLLRGPVLRHDDDVASQISSDDSFATDEGVVLHSPSMLLEMASPCHASPVTSNSMCSELRFPAEAEEAPIYLTREQQDRLYMPPSAAALPVPPRVPLRPLNVVTEVVEDSPRCSLVSVDSPRKPWPWQRGPRSVYSSL